MTAVLPAAGFRQLAPFAGLSASYFAHIGFFNPYLPLWLQAQGLPLVTISLLASVQSLTRMFAPYAWGALSDHTGERVKLLRVSAVLALIASAGLWVDGGAWWIFFVLLVLLTQTSSMMGLTEAAMANLVRGDWGLYGKVRLWGSAGFLVTVFAAGAWFERWGMDSFPTWSALMLAAVLACTFWMPDIKEAPHPAGSGPQEPVASVLARPPVRWFFASLFFHLMAHFAIYGFYSLYLDQLGYSKTTIGILWAVGVVLEIGWFYAQGRVIGRWRIERWLAVCGVATFVRMGMIAWLGGSLAALFVAQLLHALTFAAHHTCCVAMVTQHFPGRMRGRGQAMFTVIGYGFGGVLGTMAGGAVAQRWGFEAMFWGAAGLGLLAALCAQRARRLG